MLPKSVSSNKRGIESKNHIISIDVGNKICGVAIISNNSLEGFNIENEYIIPKLKHLLANNSCIVLIEDIKPYNKRIHQEVIDTCKFIGELTYRVKNELKTNFELVARNDVRRWVFNTFPEECIYKIDKRIAYLDSYGEKKGRRRYRNKNGELRKASFNYVDDRIIISIMKKVWNIPTPKPGKKNIYGFTKHAWQALAIATFWLKRSH